ncbi:MAG: FtsX-like permease family protein [Syntrophales bacterium]|nr:FtsX-like permease family protein [Syntrophales bacterium]MDD5642290.1 FtsX-like permease family protein [Syntrophales bacterium]
MSHIVNKQRNILDFALSSLLRRKGKNLALVTVYTLVVFALASVMFFTQALKKEATLVLGATPELIVQKLVAGRHDLIPVSYIGKIKKIRGVAGVEPRLWGYYYDPLVRANYTLLVNDKFKLPPQNILVGAGIARVRGAYRGRSINFFSYDGKPLTFRVRGVLSLESELLSADLIMISTADFRRLFGIPEGYATDLTVHVRNHKEVATVAAKIQQFFPDTRPILRDEILRTYKAVFDWRSGIVIVVLAGALLAFLIFAWDKAAGLSAEERREIGILKAIGWETSDVLQLKFWEGLTVSLTAFLVGTILAYVHVFWAAAPLFATVIKGWSTLYPNFRLTPFLSFYQIAILFFFTVVPYTVATIIPSWRAATIDPDQVMRT